MNTACIRFYEELNDFLPAPKRKVLFPVVFKSNTPVKSIIEAENVPHAEVDLILVNGHSVAFGEIIKDGDHISVYPEFESLDISPLYRLRPKPLREPQFVLDVHLGKLARYLRMLGFDSLYDTAFEDEELARISSVEKRCILTRDRKLLMRKEVERGYWIRSDKIGEQVKEVIRRFDLGNFIRYFSVCTLCNGLLSPVDETAVRPEYPHHHFLPSTAFYRCERCGHFYWNGTHFSRFEIFINGLLG
jgi:uncharacterized protein with PIN domain